MHKIKSLRHNKHGVSEIIGTMLLLGSAVVLFSVVYFSLLSINSPVQPPDIDLASRLERDGDQYTITVEHWGGEPVDVNARFFVEIAGSIRFEKTLKDIIVNNDKDENVWNFGEQLMYSNSTDIRELQVDMGIADVHSNSLVLLNTLQEGYRISPFGYGGIWHFDENEGTIAHDSSGNLNHGTITGENWTEESKNSYALSFDGFTSLVHVPDRISLDIQRNLTMEAWVKPKDLNVFISQSFLTSKFAYTPDIVHVEDDVYAVVTEKQQKDGELVTINVSELGEISVNEDKEKFGNGSAKITLQPEIKHVSENIFLIGFVESDKDAILKTYKIYPNATFEYLNQIIELDSGETFSDLSIEKIGGNTFAVIYTLKNSSQNDGIIRILNVSDAGEITETGSYKFFPSIDWLDPHIYKTRGDIFAIIYSKGDSSYVRTVNISEEKGVYYSNPNVFSISDYDSCIDPYLVYMNGGLCTILYGSDSSGYAKTIRIYENHTIKNTGFELQLSNEEFYTPHAIKSSETTILLVFSTAKNPISSSNSNGFYLSVLIDEDGNLSLGQPPYKFESSKCFYPKLFKRTDTVYGIIYTVDKHSGTIKTIFTEPDPEDMHMRVLGKKGSYGFNVNASTVFVTLNGNLYSTPIILADEDGWYHVVVTFDQYEFTIYVNNQSLYTKSFVDAPVTIAETDSPLLFGRGFYGIIDEVGLYGRVLSREEISRHYESPGTLD